ncbi:tetratricopeptide repeat protein [Bradyrhizobium sp. 131]|nr:tetratricopeptide repeat protein [Bradyrhizobium sp. 131]
MRENSLGPDHPDVAKSLTNLGFTYYRQGRYADAEPLCKRSLARRRILQQQHDPGKSPGRRQGASR